MKLLLNRRDEDAGEMVCADILCDEILEVIDGNSNVN